MKKLLFIHPRKGLFRMTTCKNCNHVWECERCDANLVTYRTGSLLQMICNHCQTHYEFPAQCPKCNSTDLYSGVSGIDDIAEQIEHKTNKKPIRLDQGEVAQQNIKHTSDSEYEIPLHIDSVGDEFIWEDEFDISQYEVYMTTRVFDPSITYSEFEIVVLNNAHNLLASPDYLSTEETMKQLMELFLRVKKDTEVKCVTHLHEHDFFVQLSQLNPHAENHISLGEWYKKFLERELQEREKFKFPPYFNMILFTCHEKSKPQAAELMQSVYKVLDKETKDLEIELYPPYPARMVKRKDLFSHHILLKFPRNFKQYAQLQTLVRGISDQYRLQARLNPRHVF